MYRNRLVALWLLMVMLWMAASPCEAQRYKYDFVVPRDGNFMQAIKAANNREDKDKRFRIFIHSSMYRIKGEGNMITITENGKTMEIPSPMTVLRAPNTSIIGEGMKHTQIESMPMHEGISITSTLFLDHCDSTYIQDIELWSNYRNDFSAHANRAVALNEKGCRGNIFKNLSLLSTQDTYYTNDGGTTYLEDCSIAGTVDFICGGGTIYFNRCNISLRPRGETRNRDVICAPATEAFRDYGYVFNSCRIEESNERNSGAQNGRYMLGRPWKNSPKAVFLGTVMDVKPDSLGWTEMHGTIPSLFAEYESMDKDYQLISTEGRRKEYKNKEDVPVRVMYDTQLNSEEASKYDIDNVFPGWHPDRRAALVEPPVVRMEGKNKMVWDDVDEAYLYAICKNRDVVAFTTEPHYTVPRGTAEGACFSVRCANWYGGLGDRSNEVVYPNR